MAAPSSGRAASLLGGPANSSSRQVAPPRVGRRNNKTVTMAKQSALLPFSKRLKIGKNDRRKFLFLNISFF